MPTHAHVTNMCPFASLQELGGCGLGSKCFWAHGSDDLDTKAFSFDFPLVNANRQPGEWDRVGRKTLAIKTSKGKQAALQSTTPTAWGAAQHHRLEQPCYLFILQFCLSTIRESTL